MKLIERFNRLRFDLAVRKILQTPPLQVGGSDYCVLSMVQHRDVLSYLLALKSLARFLPPARVVLVADPSLNAADRKLLRFHVPHIEICEAADFRHPNIPVGGCWERLSAIAKYAAESYVVQLDADTITMSPPTAVMEAIREGRSFTLGTEDIQPIISCEEAASWAKGRLTGNDHIQLMVESVLDQLAERVAGLRYARGCAGFAGFARNSISKDQMLKISLAMRSIFGEKWSTWGTEQFTSNLIVCSAEGARLLPHPRYCHPGRLKTETVFLHFIGFVRYKTNLYARLASKICTELMGRA